jgi:hypothetical protein
LFFGLVWFFLVLSKSKGVKVKVNAQVHAHFQYLHFLTVLKDRFYYC